MLKLFLHRFPEPIAAEWDIEPHPDDLKRAVDLIGVDVKSSIQELNILFLQGSPLSAMYLGDIYTNGRGVKRDTEIGKKWYEKSFLKGSIEAGFRLSFTEWHLGRYDRSVEILKNLSLRGFAPASYLLGLIYFDPKNEIKDCKLAMNYLQIAARNGHLLAKRRISIALRQGIFGILGRIRGYAMLLTFAPMLTHVLANSQDSFRVRGWDIE